MQGHQEPEPSCLAPRDTAIQKQSSLSRWQQEFTSRLLRDIQLETLISENGPFLPNGVRQIRWTSDHDL